MFGKVTRSFSIGAQPSGCRDVDSISSLSILRTRLSHLGASAA